MGRNDAPRNGTETKKKTAKQLGITVYIFDMNETKLSLASSCTKLRPVKNFDFFF